MVKTLEENGKNDEIVAFGLNQSQLVTIVIICVSQLFVGQVIGIQAPFFPREAMLKGATLAEVGLIFGFFLMSMIITAPIFGMLLGKICPRILFSVTVFWIGVCAVAFGFLAYLTSHVLFVMFAMLLRTLEGIGTGGLFAAEFPIISLMFPSNSGTMFGITETAFGAGLFLGPTLGTILYNLGGFTLPFLFVGINLMLTGLVAFRLFTKVPASNSGFSFRGDTQVENGEEMENLIDLKARTKEYKNIGGFFSLLRIPDCILAASNILIAFLATEFLQPTLEPFLREKFGLNLEYTGLIFLIDGLIYSVVSPIWGKICDSDYKKSGISTAKYVTFAGCVLNFLGFLLIGPVPGFPFSPSLWMTIVGLTTNAIGYSAIFVSGFLIGPPAAISAGFPDTMATNGFVTGILQSCAWLGAFIGTSCGGALVGYFGFEKTTLFILLSQLIMGTATLVFIIWEHRNIQLSTRKKEEKNSLDDQSFISLLDDSDPKWEK